MPNQKEEEIEIRSKELWNLIKNQGSSSIITNGKTLTQTMKDQDDKIKQLENEVEKLKQENDDLKKQKISIKELKEILGKKILTKLLVNI